MSALFEVFEDRVVEHPGRVDLTGVGGDGFTDVDFVDGVIVASGTSSVTVDVTRNEGTVTKAGTALTAENLNDYIDDLIVQNMNTRWLIANYFAAGETGMYTHFDGYVYLIIWRSVSGSGSYGIDMVTISNGTVSSNELVLKSGGTHLPSYSYDSDLEKFKITNTASSTPIVLFKIGHLAT